MDHSPQLIVILGPTASGKSSLGIRLAQRVSGEIICADSRTVYKGLDIGTAKPTAQDQLLVPHHLLDVVAPDEQFTVAVFQKRAQELIKQIAARGSTPILVGGTGLYIDSLLFNFTFAGRADISLRQRLESMPIDELQTRILELDIPIPRNEDNPRHLIRAIERAGTPSHKHDLRPNTFIFGVTVDREKLKERIIHRVQQMMDAGLELEVFNLSERFSWDAPGMLSIGYREWRAYFMGQATKEDVQILIQNATWQYAKRQITWFKRNNHITWLDDPEQIIDRSLMVLNKNPAS